MKLWIQMMDTDNLLPAHVSSPSPASDLNGQSTPIVFFATSKEKRKAWMTVTLFIVSICTIGLSIGFFDIKALPSILPSTEQAVDFNGSACTLATPFRREWRALSPEEKIAYIDAVLCLKTRPSRVSMNHSLYDDFSFIHYQFNEDIHFAASFLPWHRYFIHIYHRTLVEECRYLGELPYWDWTLDWQDLSAAPVWDLNHGFSGNGAASSDPSPYFPRSHCVTEGRLAHFQVVHMAAKQAPHCLTRDFGSNEEPVANLSRRLQPSAIETLMYEDDYFKFLVHFEAGPHVSIPKYVMGDFQLFSSPNDPIFFVHHAQVDRLWSQWQEHDVLRRRGAYGGRFRARVTTPARLTDVISLGGLAPEVRVSDLMDTQSGPLCYRYS